MGLWDLEPDASGQLRRVPMPLVGDFKTLVAQGVDAVGPLGRRSRGIDASSPAAPR
jgi:hypothetical protein